MGAWGRANAFLAESARLEAETSREHADLVALLGRIDLAIADVASWAGADD